MSGLSPKQCLFVLEFAKDKNATQAAVRAGYSKKSAHVTGSRLLKNDKIVAELAAVDGRKQERSEITADIIFQEVALIGMAQPDLLSKLSVKDKLTALGIMSKLLGLFERADSAGKSQAVEGELVDAVDDQPDEADLVRQRRGFALWMRKQRAAGLGVDAMIDKLEGVGDKQIGEG